MTTARRQRSCSILKVQILKRKMTIFMHNNMQSHNEKVTESLNGSLISRRMNRLEERMTGEFKRCSVDHSLYSSGVAT